MLSLLLNNSWIERGLGFEDILIEEAADLRGFDKIYLLWGLGMIETRMNDLSGILNFWTITLCFCTVAIAQAPPQRICSFPGLQFESSGFAFTATAFSDLDGDCDEDVLITSEFGDVVVILLNRGDGRLSLKSEIPTGESPEFIATEDFDTDGDEDFVVLNVDDDTIGVYLNQGDASFAPPAIYPSGFVPSDLATGDLNGDSSVDIVVADLSTGEACVYLNDGFGDFGNSTTYDLVSPSNPSSVCVKDLNGDGFPDLAFAIPADDQVAIAFNDGEGAFDDSEVIPVGDGPEYVVSDDLDGDGNNDLAVASTDSGEIIFLYNDGSGQFSKTEVSKVNGMPRFLTVSDADLDGFKDVSVLVESESTSLANDIVVYLNPGTGIFDSSSEYRVGRGTFRFSIGRLNGDLTPDYIFADRFNSTVTTLIGMENGTLESSTIFETNGFPDNPTLVELGDVDSDNGLDIVSANSAGELSVMFNDGTGKFIQTEPFAIGSDIHLTNLNDDELLDVVVVNSQAADFGVFINLGAGIYEEFGRYPTDINPIAATSADLDGDSDRDVLVIDAFNLRTYINDGAGNLTLAGTRGFGFGPSDVVAGDLDGDNLVDVAVANEFSEDISIFINHGDATYAPEMIERTIGRPTDLKLADFDLDGDLDIAASAGFVCILFNNGDGNFDNETDFYDVAASSLAVAEIDGQHGMDIITLTSGTDSAIVLFNDGNAAFINPMSASVDLGPRSMDVGDIDGDNLIDIVTANTNNFQGSFTVLHNRCIELGDINLDGNVDLLDVADFLSLVSINEYREEADINRDGKVDMQDVVSFIKLLIQ